MGVVIVTLRSSWPRFDGAFVSRCLFSSVSSISPLILYPLLSFLLVSFLFFFLFSAFLSFFSLREGEGERRLDEWVKHSRRCVPVYHLDHYAAYTGLHVCSVCLSFPFVFSRGVGAALSCPVRRIRSLVCPDVHGHTLPLLIALSVTFARPRPRRRLALFVRFFLTHLLDISAFCTVFIMFPGHCWRILIVFAILTGPFCCSSIFAIFNCHIRVVFPYVSFCPIEDSFPCLMRIVLNVPAGRPTW